MADNKTTKLSPPSPTNYYSFDLTKCFERYIRKWVAEYSEVTKAIFNVTNFVYKTNSIKTTTFWKPNNIVDITLMYFVFILYIRVLCILRKLLVGK